MTELETLEALAKAATPGPWFAGGGTVFIDTREQVCCGKGYSECCGNPDVVGDYDKIVDSNPKDAAFIAAANPQAILTLIQEKREMEEALKFYANARNYMNLSVDQARKDLSGGDPTVSMTVRGNRYEAPSGCALSAIQLDEHGNRARSALTPEDTQ